MEAGNSRVMKCVFRFGISVGRRSNQCAERRVRRSPLEGIPFKSLAFVKIDREA